eukprot:1018578-Pleurochrysis_carterae.AAC.5
MHLWHHSRLCVAALPRVRPQLEQARADSCRRIQVQTRRAAEMRTEMVAEMMAGPLMEAEVAPQERSVR